MIVQCTQSNHIRNKNLDIKFLNHTVMTLSCFICRCILVLCSTILHFFQAAVSHIVRLIFVSVGCLIPLETKNRSRILALFSLLPHFAMAGEGEAPSKEVLYLQYNQIASQVRNSAIEFATREVSKTSPNGDETFLIKYFKLFTYFDEAQIRIIWNNGDLADWKSRSEFSRLGQDPSSAIDGVDRTVCFRSKDMNTAEIQKFSSTKKVPYSILMATYESEHPLGAFFLSYVSFDRKWNYRSEFSSAGKSLVDEFFQHEVKVWSDPIRTTLDDQERWRVDISLSGERIPLMVRSEYGRLEGEDILSGWFETNYPCRLRAITRERRFYYNGTAMTSAFTGARFWERRVDLSDYDRSPSGLTFPMQGRETIVMPIHPIETFDEVAAACQSKGMITIDSEHYNSLDRAWYVKQIEPLETDKGLWVEPGPGMLVHNVDAGTEVIFGKSQEESAAILGYDATAKRSVASNPLTTPSGSPSPVRNVLIALNVFVVGGLLMWYFKTRRRY